MKALIRFVVLLILIVLNDIIVTAETFQNIPGFLQTISVKVKTSDGKGGEWNGSGVAITRKDSTGTNDVTFIWTAAHLFHHNNNIISIIFFGQSGTNDPIIDHAMLEQPIVKNGEVIGKTNILAKLIKYSDSVSGHDLAVLKVDGKFFNTNTVTFASDKELPRVGDPLYSVTSPYGEINSFSTGVYSFIGRMDDYIFDQTTCVIYPGSSGGGIFSPDGKCLGLTTVMRAPSLNYSIPIRRMRKWAKQEHIEWTIDPNFPMPSVDELRKIQIEDIDKVYTNTASIILKFK